MRFTLDELEPYEGQWVAFSPDGSRIVASAGDIVTLNERVRAAGENPEEVSLERIVLEDNGLAPGAELIFVYE